MLALNTQQAKEPMIGPAYMTGKAFAPYRKDACVVILAEQEKKLTPATGPRGCQDSNLSGSS
jgi:hypothetical protein